MVRQGKGAKDRRTLLPQGVRESLAEHLQRVKALHEADLAAGFGEVYLPDALDRKLPGAAQTWVWQYLFPSARRSVDPRSGAVRRHHANEGAVNRAITTAVRKAGLSKRATSHRLRHSLLRT